MEAISWLFRLLFLMISLGIFTAGILVLLGRRIPGMLSRDRTGAPTGAIRLVGNPRFLGAVWVSIGLFGLLFGVMAVVIR